VSYVTIAIPTLVIWAFFSLLGVGFLLNFLMSSLMIFVFVKERIQHRVLTAEIREALSFWLPFFTILSAGFYYLTSWFFPWQHADTIIIPLIVGVILWVLLLFGCLVGVVIFLIFASSLLDRRLKYDQGVSWGMALIGLTIAAIFLWYASWLFPWR